ncbi:MAG: winged helix-turn-helix transcriptional regulator [Thermodesulfobacteriota bacterium]|nr:winged helix-turn-helix transcriptional regulator [Thermodesulfobacteriota bacterium]
MDKTDLRTLKILEEIGNNDQMSQRHLAGNLGISLGLVNSFIKRLANKGYCKVVATPKNRFKYILTPKGFAEKTRLSYKYIIHSYQFYREARHNLRERLLALETEAVRHVAFYGITDFAEIAYLSLHETPLELVAVGSEIPTERRFFGYPVLSTDQMGEILFDRILITDIVNRNHLMNKLKDAGVFEEKIILP